MKNRERSDWGSIHVQRDLSEFEKCLFIILIFPDEPVN